ncbi:GTPase HflX [Desulfatiferula olefinivorans]
MKTIFGNTDGLKADQKRRLDNLYRRKEPSAFIVSSELCHEMARLSFDIQRQIGLLINRAGKILYVIVGDAHQIVIPPLADHRVVPGRLLGLKYIHTHLTADEALSRDDITDLSLLRFDLMAAVTLGRDGNPHIIHWAHVRPETDGDPCIIEPPVYPGGLMVDCDRIIRTTEAALARNEGLYDAEKGQERAILVSVSTETRADALDSLDELKELARSSDIRVLDTVLQLRHKPDPRYLLGQGKLSELTILAMQKGATILIFDQELNPSQIRSITNQVEIKVIDRTQMILDIFARRAQTREGKLQVELAQLKYLLPRLVTQNTAMSRLTGGIGGRGPGETKLELNRRRVHDRINALQKALEQVKKQRGLQKSMRKKKGVPVISIVGYTNAGKSTLLNTLTQSRVLAEDQLFATLDPSSRRLRFPADVEVIITDTVGFIRNLPKELMVSFRATLEELENADILLHVIDISNPRFEEQIHSVNAILGELKLDRIPTVNVLNKSDRVPRQMSENLALKYRGFAVCAQDRASLLPLLRELEKTVEPLVIQPEP